MDDDWGYPHWWKAPYIYIYICICIYIYTYIHILQNQVQRISKGCINWVSELKPGVEGMFLELVGQSITRTRLNWSIILLYMVVCENVGSTKKPMVFINTIWYILMYITLFWLVVWTPLKNISQLGWIFPIYGKKCSKPPTSYHIIITTIVTMIQMRDLDNLDTEERPLEIPRTALHVACWQHHREGVLELRVLPRTIDLGKRENALSRCPLWKELPTVVNYPRIDGIYRDLMGSTGI